MNNLLKEENIFLNIKVKDKKDLFKIIAEKAKQLGLITNEKAVLKSYIRREKLDSTGFEDGFAIPHAKCEEIIKPAIFYITLNSKIKWKTLDKQPIKYVIALLIPEDDQAGQHIEILSSIASKLMDDDFRQSLKISYSAPEIFDFFKDLN